MTGIKGLIHCYNSGALGALFVGLYTGTGDRFDDVARNIIILREAPAVARVCHG